VEQAKGRNHESIASNWMITKVYCSKPLPSGDFKTTDDGDGVDSHLCTGLSSNQSLNQTGPGSR
jgi:hypothetical protein